MVIDLAQLLFWQTAFQHDQSIYAAADQVLNHIVLNHWIKGSICEDYRVTAAIKPLKDTPCHRAEMWAVDELSQHPDGQRLTPCQSLCKDIGLIVQFLDRGLNGFSLRFFHRVGIIQ